LVILHEFVI